MTVKSCSIENRDERFIGSVYTYFSSIFDILIDRSRECINIIECYKGMEEMDQLRHPCNITFLFLYSPCHIKNELTIQNSYTVQKISLSINS